MIKYDIRLETSNNFVYCDIYDFSPVFERNSGFQNAHLFLQMGDGKGPMYNLPDGTSNFFFQISLKMKKKMFRVCAFVTRSRLIAHLTLTYL